MTHDQFVAVVNAYDELIKAFDKAKMDSASKLVKLFKEIAEVKREREILKEESYFETGSLEIH